MIGAKRGAELHVSKGRGAGYQEGGTKKEMWGGGGRGADRPFRSMSKNYTKLVLKPLNKNY